MPESSEKQLIKRIVDIRKANYGLRGRSNFAADLGLSPSTYFYYEQDRVPPTEILLKMAQLCNVSIEWLLTGSQSQTTAADNGIFSRLNRLFSQNPASISAVEAFVELLEQQNQIAPAEKKKKNKWIPVLGRTAAGVAAKWADCRLTDSNIVETQIEDLVKKHLDSPIVSCHNAESRNDFELLGAKVNLIQTAGEDKNGDICEFLDSDEIQQLYPDCFALRVDGDSMAPRINDGNIVVLSPSAAAAEGKAAVFKIKDTVGVTCKLFRKQDGFVHLIPINELFKTKTVKEEQILWGLNVLCCIKL